MHNNNIINVMQNIPLLRKKATKKNKKKQANKKKKKNKNPITTKDKDNGQNILSQDFLISVR